MSIAYLLARQNQDGGWPYVQGSSWTEPTVYATLALLASGERDAARRGLEWVRRLRRSDGGWPPQASVDESSWVTALVALLPADLLGAEAHTSALHWLLNTSGEEATWRWRLSQWIRGADVAPGDQQGWPWVPGNAAWIGPTALAVVALEKANRLNPTQEVRNRIAQGRTYLLAHICAGGGWNHGASRTLELDLPPYPETTGMGLVAMRGIQSSKLASTVQAAQKFLASSRSPEAVSWLRLGLLGRGELARDYAKPAGLTCRTVSETALDLLVSAASEKPEVFWG